MTTCDVSVIIPNYNRTALLHRAVQSILGQSSQPRELIIVDDHSDDDRFQEVQSIAEYFRPRLNIVVLRNSSNRGANYSRNRGIDAATQKYIAFLDSDDAWMPTKLEHQIGEMENAKLRSGRPVLSSTGRYRVDTDGQVIARQDGGKSFDQWKIRKSNFIGTLSSVVVEAKIAREVGGFDEVLPACQDWDFFIRLADKVQFVGVDAPLCIYVDHNDDRITLNHRRRLQAHLLIYKTHIRPYRDVETRATSEFHRNLAEDYQAMGRQRKAVGAYARYSATRVSRGILSHIPFSVWNFYYSLFGVPSIKERRYQKYRDNLKSMQLNQAFNVKLKEDQALIKSLICGDCVPKHNSE